MLCFFHAQRTGRCFPSAWFLNFRSQEKKKRKKKETVKNEEMHSVSGSGTDPHVQVCAYMRSLEPEPTASPFLREKAPGTAMGDFSRGQVLGELCMGTWEQKTCLGGYSDTKCCNELVQSQASTQVCFLPCKPFFIPLASHLSPISPLPISSTEFPIPSWLLSLYTGWLPDDSDEQSSWCSSPHHVRPMDQVKWPRTVPWQEEVVLPSILSQLWHGCSQRWLCWETGVLNKCMFSWKVSSFHRNFDFLMKTKKALA